LIENFNKLLNNLIFNNKKLYYGIPSLLELLFSEIEKQEIG